MHPNRAFRADQTAMLDWVERTGFAHIFVMTPDGPAVVHAPLVRRGDAALRFHIARANRAFSALDGARIVASISGVQGYVTPNWYVDGRQQVPTWNYVAVEIEGTARMLDEDGLVDQLDALAAAHEPRVLPDNPWTRDKMDEDRFRAMLRAICAFELSIETVRETVKLSQNKSAEDRQRVIDGLLASGNAPLAEAMQALEP